MEQQVVLSNIFFIFFGYIEWCCFGSTFKKHWYHENGPVFRKCALRGTPSNEVALFCSYFIIIGIHGDHLLWRIMKKNNISIRKKTIKPFQNVKFPVFLYLSHPYNKFKYHRKALYLRITTQNTPLISQLSHLVMNYIYFIHNFTT